MPNYEAMQKLYETHSFKEILGMSTEELIILREKLVSRHDAGLNHILEELHRREINEQNKRALALTAEMSSMTRTIKRYTLIMLIFAAINLPTSTLSIIYTWLSNTIQRLL